MALLATKRSHGDGSLASKKRQRVEETSRTHQKSAVKANALDTLPWNEVAFPEKFEDAEGFLGLEELSDVEVVRDAKIGKVGYNVGKILSHLDLF